MMRPGLARPDGSGLVVFSTQDVGDDDRAEYWNGITTRFFGPLETRATGRSDFNAVLATRVVSFLRTFQIRGSSHQVRRDNPKGGAVPDAFKLLLQIRGRCRVEQNGRTLDLAPGSWCVYDTWRPYGITNAGNVEQVVIQIPRHQIIDRNFRGLAEPFLADPNHSSMAQITASFVRSYTDPSFEPEDGDDFLAETTVGLVRRALHSSLQRRCVLTLSDQLRTRIKQYIRAHLNDPDLSIDRIARAMGCSKRYLHQVFAAENTTIERHIWRIRIERCCEELTGKADKSISEIAFEWGFNSSAHFSRLFKAQVGVAPTSFRRTQAPARPLG
ncbi:MAG TPA: helix-turn-helix domain-containing protein [Bradyrhizobium sp.]|nr:helix-turn-helix domain-containing protein [Bradyrhizobium sp.]